MQRVAAALGELRVDADEILHRRHLRREDDAVGCEPQLLGALSRDERRLHDRLVHDGARILWRIALRVLVHQARQQLLIERAPVDADAHRLCVPQRDVDDGAELPVLLLLEADVAGIDAVLVERFRRGGVLAQQLVADVVEVADERHAHAAAREPVADMRHGLSRFVAIDRDAHELGACARQRGHLIDGCVDVGRIGVGHRLHDDGMAAADDARRPRRPRTFRALARRDR